MPDWRRRQAIPRAARFLTSLVYCDAVSRPSQAAAKSAGLDLRALRILLRLLRGHGAQHRAAVVGTALCHRRRHFTAADTQLASGSTTR